MAPAPRTLYAEIRKGRLTLNLAAAVQAVPTMLIVWATVTACFVGLLTYRGQLTRYEQERLFLHESTALGARDQTEIVQRIRKIDPYVKIFGVVATLVTVCIVAIWTLDAWKVLRS